MEITQATTTNIPFLIGGILSSIVLVVGILAFIYFSHDQEKHDLIMAKWEYDKHKPIREMALRQNQYENKAMGDTKESREEKRLADEYYTFENYLVRYKQANKPSKFDYLWLWA
jgi:hypothetical protein